MAKTQKERQKEYRQRKKASDPNYVKRERSRTKKYKRSVLELSEQELQLRRDKNRQYGKKFRQKKKLEKNAVREIAHITVQQTEQSLNVNSSEAVPGTNILEHQRSTRSAEEPMLVKMSFPSKSRYKTSLTAANKRIKELEEALAEARRNTEKWRKRYERLNAKHADDDSNKLTTKNPNDKTLNSMNTENEVMETENNNTDKENENMAVQHDNIEREREQNITKDAEESNSTKMTPKTKTDFDLREINATPHSKNKLKRKLLFANVVTDEIKKAKTSNNRKKRSIGNVVSGKVVKKYRVASQLHRETGLSRRFISQTQSKSIETRRRERLSNQRTALKSKVVQYMERDDVSVMLPGKKDASKYGKEKRQTRVFSDYLVNLYAKFRAENPTEKISFSVFCKLRPSYIKLTSCISRNTCLCTRHQNMSMKLKCLKTNGINITQNSESASKKITYDQLKDMLNTLEDSEIVFDEWKRVEVDGKKRMRIVKTHKSKAEFVQLMLNEYQQFLEHVGRVRSQYNALHDLKEKLGNNDLIIQMDFAENFTCSAMDEIQSAYFNATSVTLHPVVVYHRDTEGSLQHKNFIFVSDVNQHNATAVLTIIKKLMNDIKEMFPETDTIHYWTDSPSSQYRNRYIFDAVVNHAVRFGFKARWNFFEAGHGKGPCDGLGGTAKRQASEAIKQNKAYIQDATDFYAWAIQNQKSIKYRFYSNDDYEKTAESIKNSKVKPVPGTMKMHAIFPVGDTIFSREVSCYCDGCLSGTNLCSTWKINSAPGNTETAPTTPSEMNTTQTCTDNEQRVSFGQLQNGMFVAATYEKKWYVGKIKEVDAKDETVRVTFMEESKVKQIHKTYRWPTDEDELWITVKDIICHISEPEAVGRTKRQYRISDEDVKNIQCLVSDIYE